MEFFVQKKQTICFAFAKKYILGVVFLRKKHDGNDGGKQGRKDECVATFDSSFKQILKYPPQRFGIDNDTRQSRTCLLKTHKTFKNAI